MVVADEKMIYTDTVKRRFGKSLRAQGAEPDANYTVVQIAGSLVDDVEGLEGDWAGTNSLIQRMLAKSGVPGYADDSA